MEGRDSLTSLMVMGTFGLKGSLSLLRTLPYFKVSNNVKKVVTLEDLDLE